MVCGRHSTTGTALTRDDAPLYCRRCRHAPSSAGTLQPCIRAEEDLQLVFSSGWSAAFTCGAFDVTAPTYGAFGGTAGAHTFTDILVATITTTTTTTAAATITAAHTAAQFSPRPARCRWCRCRKRRRVSNVGSENVPSMNNSRTRVAHTLVITF